MDLDKARKGKIIEINAQRQKLVEEKRKLDAEFEWSGKPYSDARQELSDHRLDSYASYFELFLAEEEGVLSELHTPLKTALASQGEHEQKP